MLIFVDIETTGLNPDKDLILEVAAAAVDHDTFEVIAAMTRCVKVPDVHTVMSSVDDVVLDMHTKSDLWNSVRHGLTYPISHLDTVFANTIKTWTEGAKLPMVGNSVHFDRAFLARHMPKTEEVFHYRNIDLSGIREAARLWCPEYVDFIPTDRKLHRAMPDIEDSIMLARWAKQIFTRA